MIREYAGSVGAAAGAMGEPGQPGPALRLPVRELLDDRVLGELLGGVGGHVAAGVRCPELSGQGSNRIVIRKGTGSSSAESETIQS